MDGADSPCYHLYLHVLPGSSRAAGQGSAGGSQFHKHRFLCFLLWRKFVADPKRPSDRPVMSTQTMPAVSSSPELQLQYASEILGRIEARRFDVEDLEVVNAAYCEDRFAKEKTAEQCEES